MLIKDDLLYVCGTFKQSTGAPGNMVAAFDGQNWSDMGGGLAYTAQAGGSTAMRMKWHRGHLYVGGVFDHAGGQALNGGLAIWNGSQWSGLPGAFHTPHPLVPDIAMLRDLTFWRDSLYICGGFDQIDGQPVIQVAQYLGALPGAGTGVQETSAIGQLTLVPLGGGSAWMVKLSDLDPWRVDVLDTAGRIVQTASAAREQLILDLQQRAAGIYMIRAVNTSGDMLHAKIVRR